MKDALANQGPPWDPRLPPAPDPTDDADISDEARYCPMRLLAAFALLMAGHGRCVCTSMMLGDRGYAMAQLARAHTLCDAQLREVASRLFAFFDDENASVPIGLRA